VLIQQAPDQKEKRKIIGAKITSQFSKMAKHNHLPFEKHVIFHQDIVLHLSTAWQKMWHHLLSLALLHGNKPGTSSGVQAFLPPDKSFANELYT
jgi:hypothetical protein